MTDNNNASSSSDRNVHGDYNHYNQCPYDNSHHSGRPLFSMTMDPSAIERELDHVANELHSTVSSLLGTMHSSIFGGLDSLSREFQQLEEHHRQSSPWTLRPWLLGNPNEPRKRYRITIEEIPPSEEEEANNNNNDKSSTALTRQIIDARGNELSIQQGQRGTKDEGKTVITTNSSIAPGLLDWLLFTTHEDSFFRRLGRGAAEYLPAKHEQAKIEEIQEPVTAAAAAAGSSSNNAADQQQQQQQRPALVEKVKQVGANWEKEARNWWHWGNDKWEQHRQQHHASQPQDDQHHEEDRRRPFWLRRDNNHVLAGSGMEHAHQQSDVEHESRTPRWQAWGRHESFSQTTVTHPDGTIESKTVSSLNGETETRTKLTRPDGTVEETVTRDRHPGWGHHHPRDRIESVMAADREEQKEEGREERSWPPKAWVRRQQAQEQERNV
ncbi:hypothetical protein BGW42_000166 [Actinomortierella wolfii]|nr:hypothetical protein BGW42_000166 [Actinomortierella wolfii]